MVFLAVGTPPQPDGSTDLSFIDQVAREIGQSLNGYKVIVTKSTVPVGTAARIDATIRETLAGTDREQYRYTVASNPEFLREGSAVEDFMRPDRVVLGVEDAEAEAILRDLYSPLYLVEVPFVIANVSTAELIKYAANAFLATKISFINEIANLCEAVGADVHTVARAMGLDGRISNKFLHPGPGFGGSCFPEGLELAGLVQSRGRRRAAHRLGGLRRQSGAARRDGRQGGTGRGRRPFRQDDRGPRAVVQAQHRRRARVARPSTSCASCRTAALRFAALTPRRCATPRAN